MPPKGILKVKPSNDSGTGSHRIQWDEDNIQLTEAQKSATMKITEPKTPYIHYNSDTDEVIGNSGNIPHMELTSAIQLAADSMQHSTYSIEDVQMLSASSSNSSLSSSYFRNGTEGLGLSGSSSSSRGERHAHYGDMPPISRQGSNAASDAGSTSSLSKKRGEWDSSEEDDEDMSEEAKARRRKFQQMRAQHYNMRDALRKARELEAKHVHHHPPTDLCESDDEDLAAVIQATSGEGKGKRKVSLPNEKVDDGGDGDDDEEDEEDAADEEDDVDEKDRNKHSQHHGMDTSDS
ncbi:hypothetical protein BJ742DRAFT_804988 [Cladochytrium replicatum]|nr:hypothetical protein BJ742DRAFT_804988 [Cladochytrium replicatum]